VIEAKNKTRCHRQDIRGEEVYNTGQEKGPRELLLELGLGLIAKKQNHWDLLVIKLA